MLSAVITWNSPPKQGIVGLLHFGTRIWQMSSPDGLKPVTRESPHRATQILPTPSIVKPSKNPSVFSSGVAGGGLVANFLSEVRVPVAMS